MSSVELATPLGSDGEICFDYDECFFVWIRAFVEARSMKVSDDSIFTVYTTLVANLMQSPVRIPVDSLQALFIQACSEAIDSEEYCNLSKLMSHFKRLRGKWIDANKSQSRLNALPAAPMTTERPPVSKVTFWKYMGFIKLGYPVVLSGKMPATLNEVRTKQIGPPAEIRLRDGVDQSLYKGVNFAVSDDDMQLAVQLLASGRKLSDGLVEGVASVRTDTKETSDSFTSIGDMFINSETF